MRLAIMTALMFTVLTAQPREALLIGNHNYQHITDLNDPRANLNRLKRSLEEVDFNVEIKTDLNSENLEYAIEQFRNRLARSSDTIGFLYYTGHGCQLNHQGYLVPTNVDTTKKLKIKYHALNINKIQETLKEAGNRVNMLFLDACRDVPLGAKGSSKGLGQIQNTPKGTLVVYATQAGQIAKDNSNFINSIINTIALPNQSIRNLPYSISDAFKSADGQKPIFSAMEIPKIVLKSGYVPLVEPIKPKPVYVSETRRVDSSINNPNIAKIRKLMWQDEPYTQKEKEAFSAHKEYGKVLRWKNAMNYCKELRLGGYTDWKLPSKNQLNALYKNKNQLENVTFGSYWSSTSHSTNTTNAWFFNFDDGYQNNETKDSNGYVRCVRAGQ